MKFEYGIGVRNYVLIVYIMLSYWCLLLVGFFIIIVIFFWFDYNLVLINFIIFKISFEMNYVNW